MIKMMKFTLINFLIGNLLAIPTGDNQSTELNRRLFNLENIRQLAEQYPGLVKYNQPESNSVTINYTPQSGQTTTYSRTIKNPGTDANGNTPPITVTENYWTTPPSKDGKFTTYWNGQPIAQGQDQPQFNYGGQFWNPYFNFNAGMAPQAQPRSNVKADADADAEAGAKNN